MTESRTLHDTVLAALEDLKAVNVNTLDVREQTAITDYMIVAGGTSTRHVKALADTLVEKAKHAGFPPLGVEGKDPGEWVLVDLNEIIVHIMVPQIRLFYNLEKLWSLSDSSANRRAR